MTSKYTILNALAYVAITGSQRGLTHRTRWAIQHLVQMNISPTGPLYILTDEGRELLPQSRFWKAHLYLLEQGFTHNPRYRETLRFVSYYHTEDDNRSAFTGSTGAVFIGERFKTDYVKQFKNG